MPETTSPRSGFLIGRSEPGFVGRAEFERLGALRSEDHDYSTLRQLCLEGLDATVADGASSDDHDVMTRKGSARHPTAGVSGERSEVGCKLG